MHFLSPIWLLLLIVVAALVVAYVVVQLRRTKYVARFSNVELLGSVAPRRPGWRRHLTFALLLIALTVLSLGVARPSAAVRVPRERATVMLDIDVSLSMEATDVLPTRHRRRRRRPPCSSSACCRRASTSAWSASPAARTCSCRRRSTGRR